MPYNEQRRDWSSPDSKEKIGDTKARQLPSREDRSLNYRDWRRTIGGEYCVQDIDQLEYRVLKDGSVRLVAIIELTRIDLQKDVWPAYFEKIIERMVERDYQARVACQIARALGVPVYVCAWREDMSEFWVFNLTEYVSMGTPGGECARKWKHMYQDRYKSWLQNLR